MAIMRNLTLIATLLFQFGGAAWAVPGAVSAPGITQLVGACTTSSVSALPLAATGGGTLGLVCQNHLFNWSSEHFIHLRAGMQRIKNKLGDARILAQGDSTTMGRGGGSGGAGLINGHSNTWVASFVASLQLAGIPAKSESLTFANPSISYTQYDPRVTSMTGWSLTTTPTIGGELLLAGGIGSTLSFSPVAPLDTVTVCSVVTPTAGGLHVTLDGGSTIITVTVGTQNFVCNSATVTRGVHTIQVIADTATASLEGIFPSDSTTPGLEVINGGISGATIGSFFTSSSPWQPSSAIAIAAIHPDLIVSELGINDLASTPVATFSSEYQTSINAYMAGNADYVLATFTPISTSLFPQAANSPQFVSALYGLALVNSIPLNDNFARYVSEAYTNPWLPYFTDFLHFGPTGYADKGVGYSTAFQQIIP